MAKSLLRLKSREFRKKGLGIKTIAHKLDVSASTVSLWCRDVQLTPDQIEKLSQNARDPYYGGRAAHIAKQKKLREEKVKKLLDQGVKDVGGMNKRDWFMSGIALYWAEGFKKDNLVGFANSDPSMINFFVHWLAFSCGVGKERLKLRVGVNEQYRNRIGEIETFWSKTLAIPRNQFQKPFFQKVQWKKIYDHPENYHGVLRVRVAKSTDLLRKIHGWIEGMKLAG